MTDTTTTYPASAIGHPEWTPGLHWHHKKRFSGKAIIAGIVTALGVEIVLSLFGAALGLGSVSLSDPNAAPSATTVTIASSMWAAVSLIASIFYGGFIASRLSKNTCHHMGILHGIVAWAGTVVVLTCLLSSAAGSVFSGAANVLGGATAATAAGAGKAVADKPGSGDALRQQARDLINGNGTAPVNMTSDQAQADIVGQLGVLAIGGEKAPAAHQRLVADLESQGVSAPDAQSRVNDWQAKAEDAKQKAKQAADQAAHDAAKAALGAGVVLVLAGFVAGLGGSLGALHVKHHDARHDEHHNDANRTTVKV